MKLTAEDFLYLCQYLQGFLFVELLFVSQLLSTEIQKLLYTIRHLFAAHLHYHSSKERIRDNTKQKITFYALCVLYVLSAAVFALVTAGVWFDIFVGINNKLHFF